MNPYQPKKVINLALPRNRPQFHRDMGRFPDTKEKKDSILVDMVG
jgi:hypothetical protein